MRQEEFMKELEYLLQDIKEEEKEDALQYYRDYLDEAGPENEERVISEFGSPERIAAIIRAGISGNMEEGGEFTETGYGDDRFKDPNYQIQKRMDLPEEKEVYGNKQTDKKQERKLDRMNPTLKFILLALCIALVAPTLLKMGTGVAATIVGSIMGICFFFICIGLVAGCIILGGVAFCFFGLVTMFGAFFEGLMLIGIGLLLIGGGCFAMVLAVWFYGTAAPWIFRKTGDLCDRIFHRERGKRV
ncbi:DUF1700 domain-containing protein [Clostridium sp. AM58-1XD]|uniref:DUF1700 domain-containing protein n=1 Tax=Clostridium sp. AM58-1XD TaxID=2292307 RepID=UPI000E4CBD1F|nr:DUF1700 domain-containing protein [Clostridium sp. AM58-1XD]RGZ00583.1 DUF1700 domain-containing protein [Clostridium sp. AM58-1XD]